MSLTSFVTLGVVTSNSTNPAVPAGTAVLPDPLLWNVDQTISLTLTATVLPMGSGPAPTGSVSFFSNSTLLGTIHTISPETGNSIIVPTGPYYYYPTGFTTPVFSSNPALFGVGANVITAQYFGDGNYTGSVSAPTDIQFVWGTSVGVTAMPDAVVAGQSVQIQVLVTSLASPASRPTGGITINVDDDSTFFPHFVSTPTLVSTSDPNVSSATITFDTSGFIGNPEFFPASHTVIVVYSSDGTHLTRSGGGSFLVTDQFLKISMLAAEVVGGQVTAPIQLSQMAIQVMMAPQYPYTMSGGIHMGGSAKIAFVTTMSGGVHMGGSAKVGLAAPMSGGAHMSGSAKVRVNFKYKMLGGMTMGGHAGAIGHVAFKMTGGVHMGGSAFAIPPNTFYYTMYNGEVYLGPNTYSSTRGITMGGGVAIGRVTGNATMHGGIHIGGSSPPTTSLAYTAVTGPSHIAMGGQAKAITAYTTSMGVGSPSISMGGTALAKWFLSYTMSGGVHVGGVANIGQVNYAYIPEGGIHMGGVAVEMASYTYNVIINGPHMGGNAPPMSAFTYAMTGGMTMGGGASGVGPVYMPKMTGGIRISGGVSSVLFSINGVMSGGAHIGGSAGVTIIKTYRSSGGVKMGGSASCMVKFEVSMSGGVSMSGTLGMRAGFRYIADARFDRVHVYGSALAACNHYTAEASNNTPDIGISGVAGVIFCAVDCTALPAYYRKFEGNPGCSFVAVDTSGNKTTVKEGACAKVLLVMPQDLSRRGGKAKAALVAASTVCLERLIPGANGTAVCSGKLPR